MKGKINLNYFPIGEFANGVEIEQEKVLDIIKSEQFKKETDMCRDELTGDINKDKRREYKTTHFPLVTFGGTFIPPRSKITLKQHSGQISIDFDEYNKEKSDELFEKLKLDKYIHILFRSPSYGLKAIIKVPVVDDDNKYKEYFYGAIKYYKEYSPSQDQGCADICRLCFLSYDPDLYINENSETFKLKGKKEEKVEVKSEFTEYIPKICPVIEQIATQHQLPSGSKTRHAYLDGNVWKYCKNNNKLDVINAYMKTQGRNKSAFNDSDKFKFSCGTIRVYLKGNKDNGFIVEALKLCDSCPEFQKYKESSSDIVLPGKGKLISEFANKLGEIFSDKQFLFFKPQEHSVVEIRKIEVEDSEDKFLGFHEVEPNRFITSIEKYIVPGIMVKDDETEEWEFIPKSMSNNVACVVLQSHNFQENLPIIKRIFTVPIPILDNGDLSFPKKGYDHRFSSWLPHDAPNISNPDMPLDEARKIVTFLFKEFPFQDKIDFTNAVGGLLTPFLRGLYTNFNVRTPVFFYLANRERAGKDYCAGITGVLYEGCALEEPPISTSNRGTNTEEELRKKLLSAFISGRKRLHFANNKGHINNSVFEQVTTANVYSDRILGKSEVIKVDNELEFSLSGNIGVSYTADFANRCRFIRLMLDIENANGRRFDNPNLHNWVINHRDLILSALYSLVNNWVKKGMPKGKQPFTSFPEWADICGGVMESAGFGSPCEIDENIFNVGGDVESDHMKRFYEMIYEHEPNTFLTKYQLKEYLDQGEGTNLFPYIDLRERSGQTKFGMMIEKYVNRVMSGIRLISNNSSRSDRREYKFTKEKFEKNVETIFGMDIKEVVLTLDGNLGNLCNLSPPPAPIKNKYKNINNNNKTLPNVTKVTSSETYSEQPITTSESIEETLPDTLKTQIKAHLSDKPKQTDIMAKELNLSVGQVYPLLVEMRNLGEIMENPSDHWSLM